MSNNAILQETLTAISFAAQADIETAQSAANMWRIGHDNGDIFDPKYGKETDAGEIGTGTPLATRSYVVDAAVAGSFQKPLTSEFLTWCGAFGLGGIVETGASDPYTYTMTPQVRSTSGYELPYFTVVQQVRPGAALIDRKLVGCALAGFQVSVDKGVGRRSSSISAQWIGTGRSTEPSAITMPSRLVESALPTGSLEITLIGQSGGSTDYVTLKDFESVQWGWSNAMEPDYYPGSGLTSDKYQLAGRILSKSFAANLSFVVKLHASSSELTKLRAQTTGSAVITQTLNSGDTYTATFHQIEYMTHDIGSAGGFLSVAVQCSVQHHSTNGPLTLVTKCNTSGIGQ